MWEFALDKDDTVGLLFVQSSDIKNSEHLLFTYLNLYPSISNNPLYLFSFFLYSFVEL